LREKLKARGLRVMSVTEIDPEDLDEERGDVAETVKEHGIDYPTLLDANGTWMDSAGITGVPTFLVIDRKGRLSYRHRGSVKLDSEDQAALEAAIDKALEPAS
jgi:hypothetical protein